GGAGLPAFPEMSTPRRNVGERTAIIADIHPRCRTLRDPWGNSGKYCCQSPNLRIRCRWLGKSRQSGTASRREGSTEGDGQPGVTVGYSARVQRTQGGWPAGSRGQPGGSDERVSLRAVDREASAGDEARSGRGEEGDEVGDLLRAAEPAEREVAFDELSHPLRVRLDASVPPAAGEADRARCDAVDADPVGGEFAGHDRGRADDCGLRRVIERQLWTTGLPPPDGGDEDDRAAATCSQPWDR